MRDRAFSQLGDDEVFAEISRRKSAGEPLGSLFGELCERWRPASYAVVRRIQRSYVRGSPDDQAELYQEAVGKMLAKGLDQFRGVSDRLPGKAVAPRTFFLRIVKHLAIDRYRRGREELSSVRPDESEDAPEEAAHEVSRAVAAAERGQQRAEASEEYWRAFARLREEHPNEAAAWDLYHHQDVDDHEECARLLSITVTNSYKRVSRAQAYLKLYLLEARREEP